MVNGANIERARPVRWFLRAALMLFGAVVVFGLPARADIGIISPAEANKLIEDADPAKRPVVLDTRGGYKDYFRGHLPTAHHINFDTLRGTDNGVPVQYLPEDLTREHIHPTSRGGYDSWMNCITACRPCNGRKGNRLPEEANMSLLYLPYVPSLHEDMILRGRRILADQMEFLLASVPRSSRLHG